MGVVAMVAPEMPMSTRLSLPEGEAWLAAADDRFAMIFETGGLLGPPPVDTDLFVGLAEAIVSQQLSGKAAGTIWNRLLLALPAPGAPGAPVLDAAMVAAAPEEAFRGAGLSGAKTASLKDLAARVIDGRLALGDLASLDDDEVKKQLCAVRGIGPWTAEMALIFHLGRPDVLPVSDLGIRKAFARHWSLPELPEPEAMTQMAASWRPWRSLACRYLWRSLDVSMPG
jgi:DNA-3-methyladenine glycosylase II